jgi:hypothetical protein
MLHLLQTTGVARTWTMLHQLLYRAVEVHARVQLRVRHGAAWCCLRPPRPGSAAPRKHHQSPEQPHVPSWTLESLQPTGLCC